MAKKKVRRKLARQRTSCKCAARRLLTERRTQLKLAQERLRGIERELRAAQANVAQALRDLKGL